MEKYRGIIIASLALLAVILVGGNFLLGMVGPHEYGPIAVDEQAVGAMLRQSTVMNTDKYSPDENTTRLNNATRCIKDRIYVRLAHFTKAKAMMDCDRKLKDIMMGVAEGLKDAGVIDDQQFNTEFDYIEATLKSSLFPDLVPLNFCNLAK